MRIDNPIGSNAALTGSFSGSFQGNGSGITNVAASSVEYADVLNKPTLLSGSAQIASAISGSFAAVSASIATRFDNLGTGFATDEELSNVSSSIAGDITNIYNTYATDNELAAVSSSIAGDITNIYSTYATDNELAAVSSSFATRFDNLDSIFATDNELAAVSSSFATRFDNLDSIFATDNELAVVSSSLASGLTTVNNTINALDSTYATDAALSALSSSLIQVDSNLDARITSVSSSLETTIQNLAAGLSVQSGSFATRIDNINTTINNLDSTYATDADLTNVSSSFASRIVPIESSTSTATSTNNVQDTRLGALEAATGSYQATLTFNDTAGQAGINFTSAGGTITAVATGLSTADSVTFNNGTFNNGTFNGNVHIDGNLVVSGSSISLDIENLKVKDAFIHLNSGSNNSNPDIGFAGNYNDGTYHHAGFFRDASDGTWKVFQGYDPEPDDSIYINTAHASFELAPFQAARINATSITGSLLGNASTASNLATARTITLGGDLSGNVSFDGSTGVTLTATIAANSVALGTDTTGDYVSSLVAGSGISLANNSGESATPTISIDSTVVTLTGTQTLTNKTINASQLVDASITNAKLANSSITVTAGTGMSGGGSVALGSSITLTNAGVTSNVAGSGITVSGGTGAVTITNDDKGSSQNIFKNVAVAGQSTVVADTNDDTLTLAAGSNVTITTNASTDTITIAATDTNTTYTASTGLSLAGTVFSIDSTVATLTGTQTLTNKTIAAGSNTISGLTNSNLSGTAGITNANLANSTISGISLGSNLATLTIGTGLSGTSYNGSTAVTIANSGVTSAVAGTGISVSGATGAVTITNTITNNNQLTNGAGYITSSGNVATVGGLTPIQFFNNMGQSHSARTSFDASTASYDFGFRYIQGSGNGPATGGQYYSWYIGLGNEYPATGAGSYGMYVAINRTATGGGTPYLAVRYNENNTLGSWAKISAGYADTAGSLSSMNISQFTNNSGYITASSTDTLTNKSGNISQWSNNSGYQTSSGTVAAVSNTVTGTNSADLVYGNMADNDQFRIRVGGTSSNAGFVEIATADDATEPIHVRQYTGVFSSLTRTATLLDGSGNTTFPGDVTAFSSDERLKENVVNIPNALDKVLSLNGVTFDWKQEAFDAGFNPTIKKGDAGILAQQVQAVLPQAVKPAPFDLDENGGSKSGENYLTVQYEKLAPLFIEAIKEQQKQIELLKAELAELKNK